MAALCFTISPPNNKRASDFPDEDDDNEIPILHLKEFQKPPIVFFGQVEVGSAKILTLVIENPNKVNFEVELEKIPTSDGFAIKKSSFVVPAKDNYCLQIEWNPKSLGRVRRSVRVNTDLGPAYLFHLHGESLQSVKLKNKLSNKSKKQRITHVNSWTKSDLSNLRMDPEPTVFIDGNLDNNENIFDTLDQINPLPSTPVRRETYLLTKNNKRYISQREPLHENTKKDLTSNSNDQRKTWSSVEPVPTVNLLQLPAALKDSLSSNETVNSTCGVDNFITSSRVHLNETHEFEDSLNESAELVAAKYTQELDSDPSHLNNLDVSNNVDPGQVKNQNDENLEKLNGKEAKYTNMYQLLNRRLNSHPSLENPFLCNNKAGTGTTGVKLRSRRSNSDSSMFGMTLESSPLSIDVSNSTINRRISTTKKEALGQTNIIRGLQKFPGSLIEASSSGTDSQENVSNSCAIAFNLDDSASVTRKIRKSRSFSARESATCSPKKNTLTFVSPKKRSVTGRARRSKPFLGLFKPVAQSKLSLFVQPTNTIIPHHPNMFAAKNMFYDERWQQKEEIAFTRWINYLFSPPEELLMKDDIVEAKISESWVGSLQKSSVEKTLPVKLVPDKETLSLRLYTCEQNRNHLRRMACHLFQSDAIICVLRRIEQQVSERRICIREDRKLHSDFGLKKLFLDLLFCYNPIWLHVGLETVLGEFIHLPKSCEAATLSKFIVQKLLFSQDLAKMYAHKILPNIYSEGFHVELSKYILKKFLFLVFFLDKAKASHLIEHDPCLFNKKAKIKASKEILLSFSCEFLKGEGDFTRHLQQYDYTVFWIQKPLEEFNFSVSNLSQDLRCGTRLARMCELLFHEWSLSGLLRVPANSKTIKMRNMENVFKVLRANDVAIPGNIKTSDIVEGHRENTLTLLWKIIFKTQVEGLLCGNNLQSEIMHIYKSCRLTLKEKRLNSCISTPRENVSQDTALKLYKDNLSLRCLLRWCQIIGEVYGILIENFTVSFSDGRALCYILHHYHPDVLPKNLISDETMSSFQAQRKSEVFEFTDEQTKILLKNERNNLRTAFDKMKELGCIPIVADIEDISNTIPDEKVMITLLTYMNARLLNLGKEIRAARTIQLAWRRYRYEKKKILLKIQTKAAVKIQMTFRRYLLAKRLKRENQAATIIQRCYRMYKAKIYLEYLKQCNKEKKSAIKIQALLRGFLARRKLTKMNGAALVIQSKFRSYRQQRIFKKTISAASQIQKWYRTIKLVQNRLASEQTSAIIIQRYIKGWIQRRQFLKIKESAIKIQAIFRGHITRQRYLATKYFVTVIEERWLAILMMKKDRKNFLRIKQASVTIQAWFRGCLVRKLNTVQKQSAIKIQTVFRGYVARQNFLAAKKSVAVIQKKWLATLVMKKDRENYLNMKLASIKIQTVFRGYAARKKYLASKNAVAIIQNKWFATLAMKKDRVNYLNIKIASVKIQTVFRGYAARKKFLASKQAVAVIQNKWLATLVMKKDRENYQNMKLASIKIQTVFRGYTVRKKFLASKQAVAVIQNKWLATLVMKKDRENYLNMKLASIKIQTVFRGYAARKKFLASKKAVAVIENKWYATLVMKKDRENYLNMKLASIKIQTVFRGYAARKKFLAYKQAVAVIQNKWLATLVMKKDRENYLNMKLASIKIQTVSRGYTARKKFLASKKAVAVIENKWLATLVMKKDRENYLIMKLASIKIQTVFRGYAARKKYLASKNAVVIIQNKWFATLAMKKDRVNYLNIKIASVKIQTVFRGYAVRKKFLASKQAVAVIQNKWLATLVMKKDRENYLNMKLASIKIQTVFRGYAARKKFLASKQAVAVIQNKWLATLVMKKDRENYLNMKLASIKIQTVFRGYAARKKFLASKKAVAVIENKWLATLVMKKDRENYLIMKLASIKIQTVFRGYAARKKYLASKNAVVIIQNKWFATLAMKKDRVNYLNIKIASVKIQTVFRGYAVRKKFLASKQAVAVIQNKWLATLVMKKDRENYLNMKLASIKIQTVFRGYAARKKFLASKQAVAVIQNKWLATLVMKKDRENYLNMKLASIKIQTVFRGYAARKKFLASKKAVAVIENKWYATLVRKKDRENYLNIKLASVKIQTVFRGHAARKKFLASKKAVTVIENKWLATLLMKQDKEKFHKIKRASILIQSVYRGYVARKLYAEKKRSAIKIQAAVRRHTTRQKFLATKQAVLVIQKRWSAILIMKRDRENFLKIKHASITIQSGYRGYVARKLYAEQKAALKIQTSFRRHINRRNFIKTKHSISVIQLKWKATLVMRSERQLYLSMRQAAIKIQATYRGFKDRKILNIKLYAVTKIQAVYRGFKTRKDLCRRNEAATKIQAIFRGYIVRCRYLTLKNAVSTVQCYWRAIMQAKTERKNFLLIKCNIIQLQSVFRGYRIRENLRRKSEAATKIQTAFRAYLLHCHNLKLERAVCLVQCLWRAKIQGLIERNNYLKVKCGVIKIQSAFRGFKVRKDLHEKRNAAIKIQSAYRGYLLRFRISKLESAVCLVQCLWRAKIQGQTERNNYLRMKVNIIKIQSAFRGFKVRKDFKEKCLMATKIQAAVKIQAAYKGYRIRKNLSETYQAFKEIQAAKAIQQERQHSAASKISSFIRVAMIRIKFLKMRNAAITIQRFLRSTKEAKVCRQRYLLEKKAAVTIQSMWQGYRFRKREENLKYKEIRQKIVKANKEASKDKTLGKLMRDAARIILSGKTNDILQSLIHLEKASRLSEKCREEIIQLGVFEALLNLMRSCNRSLPHVELLSWCSNILLNLSIYENTSIAVWSGFKFVETALDMMKRYQERDTVIFIKMATVLIILCQDNHDRITQITDDSKFTLAIKNLYETTKRRLDFKHKALKRKEDHTSCVCHSKKEKERKRRSIMTVRHTLQFATTSDALAQLRNILKI